MKNLAIAYQMKKKSKKMADGGELPDPKKKGTQEFVKGATESKPKDFSYLDNLKKGLGYAEGGKVGGAKTSTTGNKTKTGGSNPGGASTGGAGTVTITTGKIPPKGINISNVGGKTDARNPGGLDPSDEDDDMMMSEGGDVKNKTLGEIIGYPGPKPKAMAKGGFITDNYQSPKYGIHQHVPDLSDHEKESGFVSHEGNTQRPSAAAIAEDDQDLNQHGQSDRGPYGVDVPFHDGYSDLGADIVDRIMEKRLNEYGQPEHEAVQHYSKGGRVANATPIVAGFKPNEFDDLVLRDGLESHYGDDDNSGDALGNAQEDHDREDIVARIMRSRAKKDRLPRPA